MCCKYNNSNNNNNDNDNDNDNQQQPPPPPPTTTTRTRTRTSSTKMRQEDVLQAAVWKAHHSALHPHAQSTWTTPTLTLYITLLESPVCEALQSPFVNLPWWTPFAGPSRAAGTRPGLSDGLGSPQAAVHAIDLFEHGLIWLRHRLDPSKWWCYIDWTLQNGWDIPELMCIQMEKPWKTSIIRGNFPANRVWLPEGRLKAIASEHNFWINTLVLPGKMGLGTTKF